MKVEIDGEWVELSAVGDAVTLRSGARETLESVTGTLDLAGWAETSDHPLSGLELIVATARDIPVPSREFPITFDGERYALEVSRGDVAQWLRFEVLNYL